MRVVAARGRCGGKRVPHWLDSCNAAVEKAGDTGATWTPSCWTATTRSGLYCEMLRCADTAVLRDRLARHVARRFQAPRRRRASRRCITSASPSRSIPTATRSTASCRSTRSRASCRPIEWAHIERGVIQRVTALNLLLDDLYHEQKILARRRPAGRSGPRQRQFPAACAVSRCRTRPMSTSAAPTSSATTTASSGCSKTMRAPRPGSAT